MGTGVCVPDGPAPGVLGTFEEIEVFECFRDAAWEGGCG